MGKNTVSKQEYVKILIDSAGSTRGALKMAQKRLVVYKNRNDKDGIEDTEYAIKVLSKKLKSMG